MQRIIRSSRRCTHFLTAIAAIVAITTSAAMPAGVSVPAAFAHEDCIPALDTLPDCITHHWLDGQIYKKAVYGNLLSLAYGAIEARDEGNIEQALELLETLIETVESNTPKKIAEEAAEHMIHHAREAMTALEAAA